MEIGQRIKYIRHSADGVKEGEGQIKALALDPGNRAIVHILDISKVGDDGKPLIFNTPVNTVNPSDEFKKVFIDMAAEVENITKVANEKISKLTNHYNGQIDKIHNAVLGQPIVIDMVPVANE